MATLRDIKRRIVGVKNTQQITRAMKMVAAAKLRRAQENIINARPYSRKIAEVLDHLLRAEKTIKDPLFEKRETERIAFIVVTSDRGLAGSFNQNIIRTAEDLFRDEYKEYLDSKNLSIYCIGKKGCDYFTKKDYPVVESYPGIFSANLKFEFASKLMMEITSKFINGEYDRVIIIYNEFKSVIQQNLRVKDLLPITKTEEEETDETEKQHNIDYIYEPDKITIIKSLLPRYLNAQLWTALLESYAAELGARMTAMDMATENAKELISQLQLTYNKERQASITKEILEIVSGANALQNS